MTRPFTRALNGVALLSTALLLTTFTLWVRSYWGSDYLERRRVTQAGAAAVTSESISLAWVHGEVRFITAEDTVYLIHMANLGLAPPARKAIWSAGRLGAGHIGSETPPPRNVLSRLGFATWDDGWTSSFADSRNRIWTAPAWLIAAIWAVLPAFWLKRALHRRRQSGLGHCPACGYDLRATPDKCPECGRIPKTKGVA